MPPKTITVKKGEILQHIGDLNTKVYVVKSGLLRSYTIDEKGKEHIYLFAPEKWIMADNTPAGVPAQLYIDVLEDATLVVVEKDINNAKDFVSLMNRLSVLQRRVIMLMSATAMDRYLDFIETYPDIVKRVPQRMIASYLGITPEALSRVRHQVAEQK
ncbi:MAG: Crp/Fnr family transcriptional regulator [Cryomorphaceae bacterium]